jgi:hypothetical protein
MEKKRGNNVEAAEFLVPLLVFIASSREKNHPSFNE